MGAAEVETFLYYLATDEHVSASTQNQALNALLFLYRNVLLIDLPSNRLPTDPRSGIVRRHNLDPSGLQRAIRAAA